MAQATLTDNAIARPKVGGVGDRLHVAALLLVIALAAALRLAELNACPPGLQVDEVASAYNAWCLLNTGKDWDGQSWPIFHTRAFGEQPSPIYLYPLMAVQSVLGLSPASTRLPSAILSIITVAAIYYVGRRLFSLDVGLLAAGLLAISPWHLLVSRLGVPVGLVTFSIVTALALWLWADLPPAVPADGKPLRGRPVRALLAGGRRRCSATATGRRGRSYRCSSCCR
jgi:4-amino-4-deoxy-L-arabinose transferase-like glycosyltransferase